jgi:hypothetical protein
MPVDLPLSYSDSKVSKIENTRSLGLLPRHKFDSSQSFPGPTIGRNLIFKKSLLFVFNYFLKFSCEFPSI